MARVRVVTDSACDLRADVAEDLGIEIVPLTIRFGDEEFVDRKELSVEQFYEKMATSGDLPETAAPAPGLFEEAFSAAADDGADAVLCINISSDLSATMQSATTAASALEGRLDIEIVDSKSITMGLGTMVLEAARAANDGDDLATIKEMVLDLRERTHVFGILDTLDNLKKGGRVGGAQALIGSMLSIKPMIDISSGQVEEAGKHRTRKKSLTALRDLIRSNSPLEHLAILHAEASDIDEFLAMLEPEHQADSIHVDLLGPVIGTHGGPGTLGACWVAGSG